MDYVGRMIFKRTVTISDSLLPASAFKFVSFGINYDCEVYVNDVYVGRHVGGYTSFALDIPLDALQIGSENTVKVVVTNVLTGRTTIPIRKGVWGWRNYGGLIRDVFLVATPRTWIDDLRARTAFDPTTGSGRVDVRATITNRTMPGADSTMTGSDQSPMVVAVDLLDRFSGALVMQLMSQPVQASPNKNLPVQLELTVPNVKSWSPDHPELYLLRATLLRVDGKTRSRLDETSQNVGFSDVRISGRDLLVNGERTTLRGVVWQEDSPVYGASLTYEQMEKDVVLIKSLGANAIRFAFHPPHPYMLNLCARYGLYALEEVPVWNVAAEVLADDAFQTLAEGMVREMVERDQSKPAVIAWGVGTEFDSADERAAQFVRRMREAIHALDPRPVYYGTSLAQNDVCASAADIAALVVPPVDLRTFRRVLSDWKAAHPSQPLWLLGYGKEVDQQNRNGYSDPMSQEAQARFFLQFYGAVKEAGASASFISSFADWRGDRPVLTVDEADRYIAPLGLVSERRERRLSYDMVRSLYNEEKISALPAGSHRPGFPIAHVLTGLFVIVLVGYQYGYNRRFSEGFKRALLRSYNFFADLRDLRTVSAFHTLLLAAAISLTAAGLTSSVLYHYRTDHIFDAVLTFFILWDPLKEQIIWATWHPLGGIIALTGVYFLAGIVLALLIKIVGMILRTRATLFHVYSVSVWGAAPLIFLSPLAMSLFKIMENPAYIIPSLVIVAAFLLWSIMRILKGMSVVFETNALRTYLGGCFLILLTCGGIGVYYDSAYALGSYLSLVLHLVRNLG